MARNESALSEPLDAHRAGEGVDLLRDLSQWLLQALIEAQATEQIGTSRYGRTGERVTGRSGYRHPHLDDQGRRLGRGDPEAAPGRLLPVDSQITAPHRPSVVCGGEAYVSGVSTRYVDTRVESMGAASGISKSEVSRNCAGLDERVAAFRSISALTTPAEAKARWDELADTLTERFPKAAELMNTTKTDVFGFCAFPREHWRQIWSNNPLERL
jgi:putative transposase